MDSKTDRIVVEAREGVGWLTINNPERRNAISLDMWERMRDATAAFAADASVRCVVLRGAGDKAFASGADISQFEKHRGDAAADEHYAHISRSGREALLRLDKPLIAAIRGFCMGGGLGLAMTADLRIATEDAVFGIPAARLGIAYDAINIRNLVDLVGPAFAKEILLTARRLDAREAQAIGLVNRVVANDALDASVAALTATLVDNAPLSLRAAKLTINEIMKEPGQRDLALMAALQRACFDSRDYQEGRRAFLEKRKPVFTGS